MTYHTSTYRTISKPSTYRTNSKTLDGPGSHSINSGNRQNVPHNFSNYQYHHRIVTGRPNTWRNLNESRPMNVHRQYSIEHYPIHSNIPSQTISNPKTNSVHQIQMNTTQRFPNYNVDRTSYKTRNITFNSRLNHTLSQTRQRVPIYITSKGQQNISTRRPNLAIKTTSKLSTKSSNRILLHRNSTSIRQPITSGTPNRSNQRYGGNIQSKLNQNKNIVNSIERNNMRRPSNKYIMKTTEIPNSNSQKPFPHPSISSQYYRNSTRMPKTISSYNRTKSPSINNTSRNNSYNRTPSYTRKTITTNITYPAITEISTYRTNSWKTEKLMNLNSLQSKSSTQKATLVYTSPKNFNNNQLQYNKFPSNSPSTVGTGTLYKIISTERKFVTSNNDQTTIKYNGVNSIERNTMRTPSSANIRKTTNISILNSQNPTPYPSFNSRISTRKPVNNLSKTSSYNRTNSWAAARTTNPSFNANRWITLRPQSMNQRSTVQYNTVNTFATPKIFNNERSAIETTSTGSEYTSNYYFHTTTTKYGSLIDKPNESKISSNSPSHGGKKCDSNTKTGQSFNRTSQNSSKPEAMTFVNKRKPENAMQQTDYPIKKNTFTATMDHTYAIPKNIQSSEKISDSEYSNESEYELETTIYPYTGIPEVITSENSVTQTDKIATKNSIIPEPTTDTLKLENIRAITVNHSTPLEINLKSSDQVTEMNKKTTTEQPMNLQKPIQLSTSDDSLIIPTFKPLEEVAASSVLTTTLRSQTSNIYEPKEETINSKYISDSLSKTTTELITNENVIIKTTPEIPFTTNEIINENLEATTLAYDLDNTTSAHSVIDRTNNYEVVEKLEEPNENENILKFTSEANELPLKSTPCDKIAAQNKKQLNPEFAEIFLKPISYPTIPFTPPKTINTSWYIEPHLRPLPEPVNKQSKLKKVNKNSNSLYGIPSIWKKDKIKINHLPSNDSLNRWKHYLNQIDQTPFYVHMKQFIPQNASKYIFKNTYFMYNNNDKMNFIFFCFIYL